MIKTKNFVTDCVRVFALSCALALAAGAWSSAFARDPQSLTPEMRSQPQRNSSNQVRMTCPDMTRGNVVMLDDGGALNSPQGWLFRAAIENFQNGSAALVCYYGRHARADLRSSSHVYEVSYAVNGFRAEQCTVHGSTATCGK